ncbi:hypothetical protein B0H10DRAFT_1943749 [Mycena sp. CBHHK59/15]|nr:hypothetical protein B0H10DRAFT_1943749 [Mycena sp. CBHHK59/15]
MSTISIIIPTPGLRQYHEHRNHDGPIIRLLATRAEDWMTSDNYIQDKTVASAPFVPGLDLLLDVPCVLKVTSESTIQSDLIPLAQILDLYRNSPIRTIHVYGCGEANDYFFSEFRDTLLQSPEDCTFWIRSSTGRLCAELIRPWNSVYFNHSLDQYPVSLRIEGNYLSASLTDAMAIDTLPLEVYHTICAFYLDHDAKLASTSTHILVKPGSVIRCSSSNQPEDCMY